MITLIRFYSPILHRLKLILQVHRRIIFDIAIILLIGSLSFTWFRGDFTIAYLDFSFPPSPSKSLYQSLNMWNEFNTGSSNVRNVVKIPYVAFIFFLYAIGFSLVAVEKILFYLAFVSAGFSAYCLTYTLVRGKERKISPLTSSLFYMMNLYILTFIFTIPFLELYYSLSPLILALYIKGLKEERNLNYIIYISLIWLLTTSAYASPIYAVVNWLFLFLVFIFYTVVNKSKTFFRHALKFTIILFALWSLLNTYWIFPMAFTLKGALAQSEPVVMTNLDILKLNSAPVLGALRLMGYWAINGGYKGDPYYYWAESYSSPLFVCLSFLTPLLAFLPLILKPRNRFVILFSFIAVLTMFITKGPYPPFGEINIWIFSNPLLAQLFRTLYAKIGMYIVISYAYLIGICVGTIYERINGALKKSICRKMVGITFLVLVAFSILGIYVWPFWTGDIFYPGGRVIPSSRIRIPAYYYEAADWVNNQSEDFRILSLPMALTAGYGNFRWEHGYFAEDPIPWLISNPVLVNGRSGTGMGSYLTKLILKNFTNEGGKMISLLNIKYLLFHEDSNWEYGLEYHPWFLTTSPGLFQSVMMTQKDLCLDQSFGKLDFYRNNYWQPMHIYTTSNSILICGSLSQIARIAERDDFKPKESVLLLLDELDIQQVRSIPIDTIFLCKSSLNSIYNSSDILNSERTVYMFESPSLFSARHYSGWKGVISTNGRGDLDMLVFQSPAECPYMDAFPLNLTSWNTYNSTLIYVTTFSSPLMINSILADGTQVGATAWWQTDTSWRYGGWPLIIPPNQRAIIQVNQPTNNLTLKTGSETIILSVYDGWINPPPINTLPETSTNIYIPKDGNYLLAIKVATGYEYGKFSTKIDNQSFIIDVNSQEQDPILTYKYVGPINLVTGYHQISTSGINLTMPAYEGWLNQINWIRTFTNQSYAARYYEGWKPVVRTDGTEPRDTLSFPTIDQCPYIFLMNHTSWNAYNSTLIYIAAGNAPLRIDEIITDGKTTSDIVGVWWETDWMGMNTKPVTYPVIIPSNQKAIIQINHKVNTVTLKTNLPEIENMLLYSLKDNESLVSADNLIPSNPTSNATITYEKINPTKYNVHVNASKPFFLVFSESYDNDWVAYVEGHEIPDKYHFTVNGFANGWYINKTGTFDIILEFWPQKLFYTGSAISITTFILCTTYIGKDKIKIVYERLRKVKAKYLNEEKNNNNNPLKI